jgi:hypothetical protein
MCAFTCPHRAHHVSARTDAQCEIYIEDGVVRHLMVWSMPPSFRVRRCGATPYGLVHATFIPSATHSHGMKINQMMLRNESDQKALIVCIDLRFGDASP